MRYLLIDDIRTFGSNDIPKPNDFEEWEHAGNFDAGIFALKFEGPFDVLYLDHDLVEVDPLKTGYGIMCFLEANPVFLPKRIVLVTSNPVGRKNMQVVIDRLYGENK
jgi:hypothetical protein